MNEKTTFVFAGWLSLNSDEKNDLGDAMRDYIEQPQQKQREIEGQFVHVGPRRQACPCCGRR